MDKKKRNTIFIFVSLVVALAAIIVISCNPNSRLHVIYKYISIPFQKIQAVFTEGGNSVTEKIEYLNEYDEIMERLEKLEEENSSMQSALEENERLTKENEELRKLLELKDYYKDYGMTAANVIAEDISDWYSELTIDVGTADGVEDGDPVITADGLVGIIYSAGVYSSKVMTITDEENVIMGRISRSSELVRVRGVSSENYSYEMKLDRISATADLYVGDVIITAESGGVFPRGITIGVVSEISGGTSGENRTATVVPAVTLKRLSEVFVLTDNTEGGTDNAGGN